MIKTVSSERCRLAFLADRDGALPQIQLRRRIQNDQTVNQKATKTCAKKNEI